MTGPNKTTARGLYARVNDGGKFRWERVEIRKRNPISVPGVTAYFLRYMDNGLRKVVPLGKDLAVAFIAWQNHESDVERIRMGKAPIHDESPTGRLTIADAVQTFLAECDDAQAKGKLAGSTVVAYRNAVQDFQDQVGVRYTDEITREVLLGHETWLHRHLEKRAFGKKQTTIANRFRYLNIFLHRNGIKMVKDKHQRPDDSGLLRFEEAPRQPKKGRNGNAAPDAYTLEEVNQMLRTSTEDEKDLIQFFLRLGVRDEEAQYAEWSDIETRQENGETIHEFHVQEKPQYGWKPKDKEDRCIPIEDSLYRRLMARKRVTTLIFPNSQGGPDAHLIRRLRKASGRAGLTKRPTLHKFRRTFASLMIGHSDLQTVRDLLGHTDIATTELYLATDQSKARKATKTAFNGVEE